MTAYTTLTITVPCHYVECHYAECHILLSFMLNVIIQSVIMPSLRHFILVKNISCQELPLEKCNYNFFQFNIIFQRKE
jgi:hypothetical protein